jgi:hypothetical protein
VHGLLYIRKCDEALEWTKQQAEFMSDPQRLVEDEAITLENIAAANVCSSRGDPLVAELFAKWATGIRLKSKQAVDEDLTKSYFTLWSAARKSGNVGLCRYAASEFAALYAELNRRRLPPEVGTYISGHLVEMRDCLVEGDNH